MDGPEPRKRFKEDGSGGSAFRNAAACGIASGRASTGDTLVNTVAKRPLSTCRHLHILIVEDNPGDVLLLRTLLEDSCTSFEITNCVRLSEVLDLLSHQRPDAILLDLGLPDSQGLSTLRDVRKTAVDIPIVILTGLSDEELAIQSLRDGAQDYLVKGKIEGKSLVQSLCYAIERQQLQIDSERLRLQEVAMKDEFFSHVSHELRSPLTAIYQFVTILTDGIAGECSPQQREYLQIVSRNVTQLQYMVGELLDVTRVGAGTLSIEPQLTDIDNTIRDSITTVNNAAAAKGITLITDLLPHLPSLYADPERVRQVLINLLENAIKFTRSNGTITLKAQVVPGKPEMIQIFVSDTGPGIPPEVSEKVFERLYQVSRQVDGRNGLGLGLYICRELVTRQGGRIWVDSSSEKGSTFCFTLPVLSLTDLLSPLVPTVQSARGLSLIATEFSMPEGWSSESARKIMAREVRYVLTRCVLRGLDVVLPKLSPGGKSEFVFLAAGTDKKGADIIIGRIRAQLERNEHLVQEHAQWSIGARVLPISEDEQDLSQDELLTRMATFVRKEIHELTNF